MDRLRRTPSWPVAAAPPALPSPSRTIRSPKYCHQALYHRHASAFRNGSTPSGRADPLYSWGDLAALRRGLSAVLSMTRLFRRCKTFHAPFPCLLNRRTRGHCSKRRYNSDRNGSISNPGQRFRVLYQEVFDPDRGHSKPKNHHGVHNSRAKGKIKKTSWYKRENFS